MASSIAANLGSRSQQAAGAEAPDPWENAAAAWYSRRFRPTSQAWGTDTRASVEARFADIFCRSQQADGAGAHQPWVDALAARERDSRCARPTSGAWGRGTHTTEPMEATAIDTWETRASMEARFTDILCRSQQADGPEAHQPWEDADSARGSWRARPTSVASGTHTTASMEAPSMDTWESDTRASMESPEINTWDRPSMESPPYINTWERPSMEAESMNTWERASMEAEGICSWQTRSSAAWDNWSSWSPERRRSAVRWPSEHAVLARVTVGDSSALHCGVCSLPLEPPIFQCALGLAVCSACRGPDYRRCRAMENILETLRVPCPNAAHGCDAMLAYYDLHEHRLACAHAPRARCPLGACFFGGPMAALLDHFITLHELPLTAEDRAGKSFHIVLRDGFNVVSTAVRDGGDQHLLVLNVVRQPFGRRIAAVCVRPQPAAAESSSSAAAASKTAVLELRYSANRHYQESEFDVPFADLAYGFLEDSELAQFIVPKSVHPDDQATMLVTAFISIK